MTTDHMTTDKMTSETATAAPPERPTAVETVPGSVVISAPVAATVSELSPHALEQMREQVADANGGGNRFVWFLTGFVAALLSVAVAGVAFLAVSDDDDDGNVQLDVPAVDVDVDG